MSYPIKITGLDHLVLRTANLEEMILFYKQVLGCHVERTVINSGLYQLRAGSCLIDLVDTSTKHGQRGGRPTGTNDTNLDHFCLRVDPWDELAIFTHLAEFNFTKTDIVQRYGADGMGPSVYIKDPDGNKVELKGPSTI